MAQTSPLSKDFQVTAVIKNGCVFATNSNGSTEMNPGALTELGTISFGTVMNFQPNQQAQPETSSVSIQLTCTPGMTVSISLGLGLHAQSGNQRYLKHNEGPETWAYELYQNTNKTTVWGTESNALNIPTFPNTTQTYQVYAYLSNLDRWPRAGTYTDQVTVELTY